MANQTAAEQLADYVETMGPELGQTFHHCWLKFFATTSMWDMYCVLLENKERVDLFNRSSGLVAFHIHRQFLTGTVLGLLRLLDPPKSMGKANLTLQVLSELCDSGVKEAVASRVKALVARVKPLKDVRDKILAHNDFGQATGDDEPLAFESRNTVTEIILQMLEVLNIVQHHYTESQTLILPLGNSPAFAMLHRLWVADSVLNKSMEFPNSDTFSISHKELYETPAYLVSSEKERRRYG